MAAGSEQFLSDAELRSGSQASPPWGLWLSVDPWISWGQKWGDKAWGQAGSGRGGEGAGTAHGAVKGSDLSVGTHACGLHSNWFGRSRRAPNWFGRRRGAPALSCCRRERPDPSSHALLEPAWGFGEGKGVVPRRREFETAQSFVFVGLHVLLKELLALIEIFLSGDLGAVSFQGESVVCRVGSPRKAGWQLQAVAPRNVSCRATKQGQSPALGAVAWPGHPTVPGCRPGHSKALCSPRKSPEQTGCAAGNACPASPEGSHLHHPPVSVSMPPQTCWDLLSSRLPRPRFSHRTGAVSILIITLSY